MFLALGTYCQQREVEAITEGVEADYGLSILFCIYVIGLFESALDTDLSISFQGSVSVSKNRKKGFSSLLPVRYVINP